MAVGHRRDAQIAANDHDRAPERRLRERHVHHGRGILAQRDVAHVADDAHDFARSVAIGRKTKDDAACR